MRQRNTFRTRKPLEEGTEPKVVILVSVGDVNRRELLAGALDEVSEVADIIFEVQGVDQNRLRGPGHQGRGRWREGARGDPRNLNDGNVRPATDENSCADGRSVRRRSRRGIGGRMGCGLHGVPPNIAGRSVVAPDAVHVVLRRQTHLTNQRLLWNRTALPVGGTESPRWPPTSRRAAGSRANTGKPTDGPPSGSPTQ
jgi:hypothetical protein